MAARARATKDSVGDLINPSRKPPTRDHARAHRDELRRLERQNRAKAAPAPADPHSPENFKLERFAHAESRVKQQIAAAPKRAPQGEDSFLRAHSRDPAPSPAPSKAASSAAGSENRAPAATKRRVKTKPAVPKAADATKMPARAPAKNYLKENAREVITGAAHKPVAEPEPEPTAHDLNAEYGKVPAYLRDRKALWDAQKRAEADSRARHQDCPEGMILMDDMERLETLASLQAAKDELTMDLRKFPMVVDTYSLQQRKSKLEAKLEEIDDGIEIFSRPKVFIME